ncbi:MAG: cob(I)yrinic acid a,c-diamide adenosyltransferase [Desulfocucumaceae bacterium]
MSSGKVTVLTGNGKGKTTSALGRCLEGWLDGKKVLVLQFIKGDSTYGELRLQGCAGDAFRIKQAGLGFVKNSDKHPFEDHRQQALRALGEALTEIRSNRYNIVVLDEINYAVHFNLLSESQVIEVIDQKPPGLDLILTGRYARDTVMDRADEVFEFREIKHYASRGVPARQGIEF